MLPNVLVKLALRLDGMQQAGQPAQQTIPLRVKLDSVMPFSEIGKTLRQAFGEQSNGSSK